MLGKKPNGDNQPLDILAVVRDTAGNLISGATVTADASDAYGNSWSGTLSSLGAGIYRSCNVGSFDGNYGGGISIGIDASKAGYNDGSGSGSASSGNLFGCP